MPFAGYSGLDECARDHGGKDDPQAYCAKIHYEVTGEWPAEKFEQKFGEDPVFDTPIEVAEIAIKQDDIPLGTWKQISSDTLEPFRKLAESETDPRRLKKTLDMVKLSKKDGVSDALAKADAVEKVGFDAQVNRSVSMVFKQDDEFLIWGPASVEVVDKEQDKINVEALDKALPQLLKRASLSYAHTDQLVGKILERFETDEPVEVTIDGKTYERKSFPTAVLDLDDGEPPAMFVAGEVFDDTNQSREVREKIEEGEINSYSISGEALVTQKQVDGDMVYDDILEMDLSAVTLCEEGMNQGAKFARVNGNISEIEVPNAEKSFEVENGSVSSPEEVAATVSKSMTEEENGTEEKNEFPSDFNPDAYVKQDELEGEIATKEDLNKELNEVVEKTVDAVVEEVEKTIPSEEDIAEKASEAAEEQFKSHMPDGDLATVSYIQENFAEKEGDYEEEEEEEEEEHEEEEHEGKSPEEETEEALSREQLKEDLPSDVWDVVSEYVGDTKQKSEEVEESSEADDLEKAVESILEGKEIASPGVDLGDREDELDERFEKEDEEQSTESPALSKWR